MGAIERMPRWIWRLFRFPPRVAYAFGLGPLIGRMVLLLTTIGRRSGLPRITPLQYEEIDGCFYVAAARGEDADWLRNLAVQPAVELRVGSQRIRGEAKIIRDPAVIADFLELRLKRHPQMIARIMRAGGMPSNPVRADLEAYARGRPLVAIRPADGLSPQAGRFENVR
jgi:deazaflavin-dependent oxidoreductase (nitroreductase family)